MRSTGDHELDEQLVQFGANIRAAREKLTIAGQPVPGIPVRTGIQIVFVAALAGAAFLK